MLFPQVLSLVNREHHQLEELHKYKKNLCSFLLPCKNKAGRYLLFTCQTPLQPGSFKPQQAPAKPLIGNSQKSLNHKTEVRTVCEQVKKFYPTTHFIHCLYSKFQIKQWPLCHKHTGTSNFFDLLLCSSTEELCFHNYRLLRQLALAQDFVVSLERLKKKKKIYVFIISLKAPTFTPVFQHTPVKNKTIITTADLIHCPSPIQDWYEWKKISRVIQWRCIHSEKWQL